MRIIVTSDTHCHFQPLYDIILKHREEASLFIHLGDGERETDELLKLFPNLSLHVVKGNCDYGSILPPFKIVIAGGVKILCTHGHLLQVKSTLTPLRELAEQNDCRIALYGHSHKSDTHYEDGMYFMNPGSPSQPRAGRASYGIIDITSHGIVPFIVEI
ncbi:MAG: metallophosphoesterase [Oscillospiraceae bacterium]